MTEKELLISRLRYLIKKNAAKQKRFQAETSLTTECGCITRESCEIASLLPTMKMLNVSFNDCVTDPVTE